MPATPCCDHEYCLTEHQRCQFGRGGTDGQTDRQLVATNGHRRAACQQADERDGESRRPKRGLTPFLAEWIRANASRRQE